MLKKIFESTLIMGVSSVIVLALELIRVKIMAVMLGPNGIGALSVLNHFHTVTIAIIGLGLQTGIVKYTSSFNSEGDTLGIKKVVVNSFQLVFYFSLIVFVVTIVFSSNLSQWLLDDPGKKQYVIIYSLSFPFAVFPLVAGSFLQGLKKIKSIAKIKVFRSIISLLFIVPFVYFYKLEGAIFSAIVISVVHSGVLLYYLREEKKYRNVFGWQKFDTDTLGKLIPYGFTSLLAGSTYYLSHLFLKLTIVHNLGMETNGIYQPVWALTMTYPTIVLSSMSAYSFPRLCELKSNKEIVEELNGIIRVSLLLIVPVMFLILIARKPIIQLLYSSNFLPCIDYMPVQILGDFFKVLVWSLGAFLLPTKKLKASVWLSLIPNSLLVVIGIILVKQYQLHGIVAAFTISYMIAFFVYYCYAKLQIQFYLWDINRKLIILTFISLIVLIVAINSFSILPRTVIIIVAILFWGALSIKKEELFQLKRYIVEVLSKKATVSI